MSNTAEIQLPGNGGESKWSGKLVRIMAGLDEKTRMQRFVIEIEDDTLVDDPCSGQVDLDALRP